MALEFTNATTEHVSSGSASALDNMDPFTVWLWFYIPTGGQLGMLVTKMTTGLSTGWRLQRNTDNTFRFIMNGTTDWDYTTSTTLSVATWCFTAVTFDSTNHVSMYHGSIDTPATEMSYSSSTNGATQADDSANDVEWGALSDVGSGFGLGGYIGRCGIIKSELSASQIQLLQWYPLAFEHEVFHPMGVNGTTDVVDWSGKGHNGTVSAGVTTIDAAPLPPFFGGLEEPVPYEVTAASGLSIPVAMHSYRQRRAS